MKSVFFALDPINSTPDMDQLWQERINGPPVMETNAAFFINYDA
jgi:hypothetical protein